MAEKTEITSKLLLTVSVNEDQERNKSTVIRVVEWIAKGKHYPQLEKREFFRGQDGEWKTGKAKGFNLKDLILVQDHWGEIMAALGSKLPEHQTNGAAKEAEPAAAVNQQEF